MKQIRHSRKSVEALLVGTGYELVLHEWLGNAKKPYYRYSLVHKATRSVMVDNASLSRVWKFILYNEVV